ncbi:pentapeptide repeat-containing protein [Streptomyces coriariae]|uniref:pentapeptide repeat-containing protein n=1 Tax=Streptomyces coriariae TaxID=2864460 RepID=UPI001E44BAA4|nr:pentapeptide repeat-containing protein [Streptomyces coriariae]
MFLHTQDKDREQAELTREGQVTDRYIEAIKLVGSDEVTERLGGIYSLERIMKDSERDHSTIVEVLAAFIRHRAPITPDREETSAKTKAPEDVQAALTVLSRRPERDGEAWILLGNVDLRGLYMRGGKLDGMILGGSRLDDGYFWGVSMREANLSSTNFSGSNLHGVSLDKSSLRFACFDHANLSGVSMKHANFQSARFAASILDSIDMREVDLSDALLDGTMIMDSVEVPRDVLVKAKILDNVILSDSVWQDPVVLKRIDACVKECDNEGKQAASDKSNQTANRSLGVAGSA